MSERFGVKLLHKPDEAGRAKAKAWRNRHGQGSTIETVSPCFEENAALVSGEIENGTRLYTYGGDGMVSIAVNGIAGAIARCKVDADEVAVGFFQNGFMSNAPRWANGGATSEEVESCGRLIKAYPLDLTFVPEGEVEPACRRWALFYASKNLTAEIGSLADAPEIREQREHTPRALKIVHGLGMALWYYGTSLAGGHIAGGKEHDVYLNGPEMSRVRIENPTITDPDYFWHYDEPLRNPLVLARDVSRGLTSGKLPIRKITRDGHIIREQQTWQVDGEVIFFNGTPRRLGRRGLSASATHISGKGVLSVRKSPFGIWVVSPQHGLEVDRRAA